jgi:SagB-type dehydrogenase family enzyme
LARALERLDSGAVAPQELAAEIVERLIARGLVRFAAFSGAAVLATLTPMVPGFTLRPFPENAERQLLLSRFAYLRREEHELILESPRSLGRIVIQDDRVAACLFHFAEPRSLAAVCNRTTELSVEPIRALLELLWGAGVLILPGEEESHIGLAHWEFHDLLFHVRSRVGRHDYPFGRTCRMIGRFPPSPALRPAFLGETVSLPVKQSGQGPSFLEVHESRCSIRQQGARPIGLSELGEFLFRIARVRERKSCQIEMAPEVVHMDFAKRPYPSAGSLYELEFYLAVDRCQDLTPGLYHYEAADHQLSRVSAMTSPVERLLDLMTPPGTDRPQVLILLAARFARIAWKYQSDAYALVLKHVGVVFHSMYLVATALGLAPCGIGAGDSDLFAEATGLDFYEETLVGEFVLGSRPNQE